MYRIATQYRIGASVNRHTSTVLAGDITVIDHQLALGNINTNPHSSSGLANCKIGYSAEAALKPNNVRTACLYNDFLAFSIANKFDRFIEVDRFTIDMRTDKDAFSTGSSCDSSRDACEFTPSRHRIYNKSRWLLTLALAERLLCLRCRYCRLKMLDPLCIGITFRTRLGRSGILRQASTRGDRRGPGHFLRFTLQCFDYLFCNRSKAQKLTLLPRLESKITPVSILMHVKSRR